MSIGDVIDKYNIELSVEVSEMTEKQVDELDRDMESAGFRFNRSYPALHSCVMRVYER